MNKINDQNKSIIIFKYAVRYVESLSFEQIKEYAISGIIDSLKHYDIEQLESEIDSVCPDILELT